jgi:quercetin dioxygenase-like cupin family protein
MGDYTVKRIDEMEAVAGGSFKRARAELGASAFGMQVIDMPPNIDLYPEHTHADDGQEEVYLVIKGSGEIDIEGERHPLDPGTMVRVAPGTNRKVYTAEDPIRMVIVGGVPGQPYEAPEVSQLGAPDPGIPGQ